MRLLRTRAAHLNESKVLNALFTTTRGIEGKPQEAPDADVLRTAGFDGLENLDDLRRVGVDPGVDLGQIECRITVARELVEGLLIPVGGRLKIAMRAAGLGFVEKGLRVGHLERRKGANQDGREEGH